MILWKMHNLGCAISVLIILESLWALDTLQIGGVMAVKALTKPLITVLWEASMHPTFVPFADPISIALSIFLTCHMLPHCHHSEY